MQLPFLKKNNTDSTSAAVTVRAVMTKKPYVCAFFLGISATLALPPFFIVPLLAVSFCGWYLLARHAHSQRQAFAIGWWWGLGFFMSGLYWMCYSLLVDAEKFGWLIPFCLIGLNGIIALYPAAATWMFWRGKCYVTSSCGSTAGSTLTKAIDPVVKPQGDGAIFTNLLLFALCFSLTEWARSVWFTGFPWNLVGYTWAVAEPFMQPASLIGIHGVTLLTILLALLPLLWKGHRKVVIGVLCVWCMMVVWGVVRIPNTHEVVKKENGAPLQLRLVQAAIPQSLKWDPKERMRGLQLHAKLSMQAGDVVPDVIIWPEAAIPLAVNQEPQLVRDIGTLLAPFATLISGGLRVDGDKVYSSIYAINREGIAGVYDKHHLVPFGEFVPFREILPLEKITAGQGDFARGKGKLTLEVPHLPPFTPLDCYEVIFPEDVDVVPNHTQWMVNLTNDAWFGTSTGPYQHMHMARFRAVETGLPLVRAANNGISVVVDPFGRITASLGLNARGVLDTTLPKALPTFYNRYGELFYHLMLAVLIISIAAYQFCLRKKKFHVN